LTYYIQYIERGCSVAAKQLDEAGVDKPNLWRVYSNSKRFVLFFFSVFLFVVVMEMIIIL
jgi:hypothetical protein